MSIRDGLGVSLSDVRRGITGKWLLDVLAIALVFGLIVFVHEGGHFVTARASPAWPSTSSPSASAARCCSGSDAAKPNTRSACGRSSATCALRAWSRETSTRRASTRSRAGRARSCSVAGCIMNFALAVVIFIAMGLIFGKSVEPYRVNAIFEKSPAALVGIKPDDRIVGVEGRSPGTLAQVQEAIKNSHGRPVTLTVDRAARSSRLR